MTSEPIHYQVRPIGLLAHPAWRRSYTFVVLATIAVVAAADFLLYRHPVGWVAALLAGLMLALLAMRNATFLTTPGGRVVWLAAAGLLFALIEQPTWFNVSYIIVCLGALAVINRAGWESDFGPWARKWIAWVATGWTRLFLDNGVAVRWLIRRGLPPEIARKIVGWFIPLALSGVFVALFAWANPIISEWFAHFGDWIARSMWNLPEWFSIPRMFFWLMFAIFAWMLLRGRVRVRRRRSAVRGNVVSSPQPIILDEPRTPRITAALVIRCLILFNLIFAVENALDTRYLWSERGLPPGMDYREYVRRGAYPLVAAALLAGAFVLITFRPDSQTERSKWARRLVYIWIAQTIVLTISAAWRLERYVEMSELTRLRVASTIWFFLVATGLFYVIWRIVRGRSNTWLVNVNAVTALLVLYPCCFVNFDGMIATFNARHCREAGGRGYWLDIEYYQTLGTPSLAALDEVRQKITYAPKRERTEEIFESLESELRADLSDWRGWTWRRQRTAEAVTRQALARATQTSPTPTPQLATARPMPIERR